MFKIEQVDLFLMPYDTFSNRIGEDMSLGGIIEVIKNAVSRTDI